MKKYRFTSIHPPTTQLDHFIIFHTLWCTLCLPVLPNRNTRCLHLSHQLTSIIRAKQITFSLSLSLSLLFSILNRFNSLFNATRARWAIPIVEPSLLDIRVTLEFFADTCGVPLLLLGVIPRRAQFCADGKLNIFSKK